MSVAVYSSSVSTAGSTKNNHHNSNNHNINPVDPIIGSTGTTTGSSEQQLNSIINYKCSTVSQNNTDNNTKNNYNIGSSWELAAGLEEFLAGKTEFFLLRILIS